MEGSDEGKGTPREGAVLGEEQKLGTSAPALHKLLKALSSCI